jgi:RNA polymerase sigma factor (sigma-70 family)
VLNGASDLWGTLLTPHCSFIAGAVRLTNKSYEADIFRRYPVFVTAPKQNQSYLTHTTSGQLDTSSNPSTSLNKLVLLQAIVESLIDGVILVTEQGKILRANEFARQLCRRLDSQSAPGATANHNAKSKQSSDLNVLPHEVWRVCQVLMESDRLFPNQKIIPELEIPLADSSTVRIRAQKFDWNGTQEEEGDVLSRCILVTLEDRHQALQHRAIADTLKFNLTPREREIWELRLQQCSYREIAAKLYISENTVKKHVKNILAKRQVALEQDADKN